MKKKKQDPQHNVCGTYQWYFISVLQVIELKKREMWSGDEKKRDPQHNR